MEWECSSRQRERGFWEQPLATITAFTLTRFGSDISSGTVTKRSVNRTELCRTDPRWDLLTEPGQHGSVRLFGECKHFYNHANCFQSDEHATSRVRSSQSLAEEYYECRMNDFFSKGTMDSAWTDRECHKSSSASTNCRT